MCRLSWNMGASTSWNSQGLSRPVQGLQELCNCRSAVRNTPWSRVLLQKLTGSRVVNKFSAFFGTQRFVTAFTSARHLSLSAASSIQSIPPTSHFLKIHLDIILSSTPGSSKWMEWDNTHTKQIPRYSRFFLHMFLFFSFPLWHSSIIIRPYTTFFALQLRNEKLLSR